MTIDTDKMVEILQKEKPLNVTVVVERGEDKLICLFALPHLIDKITEDKITEFANKILEEE